MRALDYKYWVALIYIIVLLLDRLDITIINVALPALAAHFKISIAQTGAISISFLVALALSMPISNWLGNYFGLTRVFMAAIVLFGVSSTLCAAAPNLSSLVLLRFLQGIGGGLLVPVGMNLVYQNFKPHEYARITSFIFMPILIAPALAPVLGGLLLKWLSWRWLFLIAAPICTLAITLALLKLRDDGQRIKTPLDWRSVMWFSTGLSLLFYAIDTVASSGLTLLTVIEVSVAIGLLLLFVRHANKTPHPLIPLHFFKSKLFLQVNFIQLTFQICHYGSFFLIGLYLQMSVHMSPLQTGSILGMQALGAISINRYCLRLFQRAGAIVPIMFSLGGVALMSLTILWITTPQQIRLGCGLLYLRGIFSGLSGVPLQVLSIIDFERTELGAVNALFTIGRQLAISFGIALFSVLLSYRAQHTAAPALWQHADFYLSFALIPLICGTGMICTAYIDNDLVKSKSIKI